jgi:hypothetical protein
MKGRKTRCVLFLFYLILATLSGSWVVFSIINRANLLFTEPVYQFVFIILCLSFVLAVFSIRESLNDTKYKIKDMKNKEKNVKDMYRYNQLLDPPDAEMNN